jgi:hypothetical protein
MCCPTFGSAESAVQRNNRDATVLEGALLIRHQSDERRDHNRWPIEDQRGNLVDQRLSKAGWQ